MRERFVRYRIDFVFIFCIVANDLSFPSYDERSKSYSL